MGGRTQAAQETDERNLGPRRTPDPDLRAGKPGRRPQPPPREPSAGDALRGTLQHFFPELVSWLNAIPDPRRCPEQCTFPLEYLIMMAVIMFCGQCGSRRQLDRDRRGPEFGANLWRLLGRKCQAVCCSDTMNGVLEMIAPEQFDALMVQLVTTLHRGKVLRHFLCDGKLVVAIDGTQLLTFHKPHCDQCLTRTLADGSTQYFHYVLAAKIVTAIGLVVPFAFEFVENPAGRSEFDKQDCEIKAARRLFRKIRQLFPRLKVMIVGDGLYADETTFRHCDDLGWDFMVTLKEGKIPALDKQLPADPETWGGRRVTSLHLPDKTRREWRLQWKTPLRYRRLILHVIRFEECDEKEKRLYHNTWITNVKPNHTNALDLAQAGRRRWKIENEGTNTQKNGGYEMEHGYGLGGNAWKNYYLILQIGQLFNDLLRLGDLLQKLAEDKRATFARLYGSVANFARRLLESLRHVPLNLDDPPWCGATIQIRLVGTS